MPNRYCIPLALVALLTSTNAAAQMDSAQRADEIRLHTDWANLERYADANTRLGPPKPGEHRVVFIGNSITELWQNLDSAFFSGPGYIDRGIGGQTTPQMLVRFRQDVIDLRPAVVGLSSAGSTTLRRTRGR